MKKKFYTCKYDKAFKEIMMKKENFNILKKVLETILNIEITNIELQPLNLNTNNIYVRGKEVDLLVTTKQGKIEIEVNTYYQDYVKVRNFCLITNIYQNEIVVGEDYNEDKNIIQINLNYGVKDNKYKRIYKVRDEENKEYIRNLTIYEINMEKYKELLYNEDEEGIEKNKYLIMLDMDLEELKKLKKDKVVLDYMEKIERLNQNPMFINWITKEKDEEMIKNTQLRRAKEDGISQGISQGITQGIHQGMDAGKKEVAKSMLEDGMDVEKISKLTGLSIKEIQKLI